jgi:hypothetical protein
MADSTNVSTLGGASKGVFEAVIGEGEAIAAQVSWERTSGWITD